MAMRFKISKADYDKLSAEFQAEYTLKGDEATLDLDGGPDVKAGEKLTGERDRRRAAEKRATEAEARIVELEEAGTDVIAAKAEGKKAVDKANAERDAATKKYTDYASKTLKNGVAREIAGKLAPKGANVLLPHIEARVTVDMSGDEPKTVFLDKDGKASTLTAEDIAKEFRDNKEFSSIIAVSSASGGGNSRQHSNPGGNGLPSHTPNYGQQPQPQVNLGSMSAKDLKGEIRARIAARAGQQAE